MKNITLVLILLWICCEDVNSQTTYAESANISSMPTGLYYQTGPGSSNVSGGYNWTYPYGTKLSLNVGASRNFEMMAIDKDARGLIYRQWTEGATWTPWRTILTTNADGRVGVGSSSPQQQVDVYSTSSHGLRLSTNAHANDQKIEFSVNNSTYHSIVSNTNSGNLQIRAGDGGTGHEVLLYTDGVGRVGVSYLGGLAIGDNYFDNHTESNQLHVEGKIGIGTTQPSGQLDVVGNTYHKGRIFFTDPLATDPASGTEYAFFELDETSKDLRLQTYDNSWGARVTYKRNGNVGIGTSTPGEKLEVNGTVRSKKVKVEANDWPDYVFAPSFELRSLTEIETFIQENQHLPDVPSAKEVETNGLDLGAMDATLLKKVEELTLYTIDQDKRIKKQDELINDLLQRLEKLEKKN